VPEPNAIQFEMSIKKLKDTNHKISIKSQLNLLKQGVEQSDLRSMELINSIWNKEELPEEWKESIPVPICKKGDKTDCSNYRAISHLQTTYKILPNILLSRLTPYAEEIFGYHHCGFRRKSSATDHTICIRQILEEMGIQHSSASAVYRLKKAYD